MSSPYRSKSPEIQKIIDKTQKDMDEIGVMPRFGFFSIPCNNTIGDQYYSREKTFNHTIVDRKVITEKRGVYTIGPKTGKGPDAYFQIMDTADPNVQKRLEEGVKKDHEDLMKTVQQRKNKEVVFPFKYPGVQSYKDDFDQHPFQRDYPLTKDPPKHYKVVEHKVITEPRGIYTQPLKKGFYNTPNILFSFTPLGHDKDEKFDFNLIKKQNKKRAQSSIPQQRAYQKAFFPASLKKNECFSNIRETYGYEDKYYNNLKNTAYKQRKNPRSKYTKYIPPTSAKHMRPFTPASLSKVGRDGLFNKDIWNCPSIPEKKVIVNQREKKEYEEKHKKVPFTYNKLQTHTKFSPSIVTNQINMKRDFPTVFKF